MTVITVFIYILFVSVINGQRVNIWSSTFLTDTKFWSGDGVILNSINCPSGSSCLELSNQARNLYRYWPTTGYHSIEIHLSMSVSGASSCQIYYIIGQTSNELGDWTLIKSYQESIDSFEPLNIADDQSLVGIQFYGPTSGSDHCWVNNVYLSGIVITPSPTDSTSTPTIKPTNNPTKTTINPTRKPTKSPTTNPTPSPTQNPTPSPTNDPTPSPTNNPTPSPTEDPTPSPTDDPTPSPTANPTIYPTFEPTIEPTTKPSSEPTNYPSIDPTTKPTVTIITSTSIEEKQAMDTTQTTVISEKLSVSNNDDMMAIYISIIVISCCLTLIVLFIIYRRIKKKKKTNKTDDIELANTDHTATIVPADSVKNNDKIETNKSNNDEEIFMNQNNNKNMNNDGDMLMQTLALNQIRKKDDEIGYGMVINTRQNTHDIGNKGTYNQRIAIATDDDNDNDDDDNMDYGQVINTKGSNYNVDNIPKSNDNHQNVTAFL